MTNRNSTIASCFLWCALLFSVHSAAQPPAGSTAGDVSYRKIAPIDLTGYWVAVVTEDWRWRMMTPPKGDYASVPLNPAGREVADAWDSDRSGDSCRAFGAAGVMRMPLRIHITWEDDFTLRLDSDHGMQTRRFNFSENDAARRAPSSLQGYSAAQWAGNPGGRFEFVNITPELSYLKAETKNLEPGYLRKNGVPYSENTVLTEYFEYHEDFGDEWITVTTIVNDPTYLFQEFITSSSFKKLDNDDSWNPIPCQ